MKRYEEFLNNYNRSKFKIGDYVKIKKTEMIGIINHIERYSTGVSYFFYYLVKFDSGLKTNYKAKDLQKATQEEVELHNAIIKYNL